MSRDWVSWHEAYADPSSALSVRLARVQAHLADAISSAPAGRIRLLSLCAGQGNDVLGVLPGHRRAADVSAVLIERDPHNASVAAGRAAEAGLTGIEIRCADAGDPASFGGALPADVLLLCGIFGNVSDGDVQRTAAAAAQLCAPGGTVIWTRHRRAPDLTPQLRSWFTAAGFAEVAFEPLPAPSQGSVGVDRLGPGRVPGSLPGGRLFSFASPPG